MDASQYKDYVLFMLFIKYISDKYGDSDDFAPPVSIPKGASFPAMLELRGKSDIGDRINTEVIAPLVQANAMLARSDFPDFNDPNKLGQGREMVDRLTNLINIFASPQLDFSQNRAEHDDILGDAYEYLMRHFATESGKSKGQFYTPAEVSRVIAKVIGIAADNTKASTTAYDPTCGSGSLLLKLAAEAGKAITLEGQEKDVTTAGLARMNMILHDFPTANIVAGNTLAAPKFKDGEQLRSYDLPRYIDSSEPEDLQDIDGHLRDHNLFQAICRTNRLDGDDKDYGHIVDFKELFGDVQQAIPVYSSDELDIDDGSATDNNVHLKEWRAEGKEKLEKAREALHYLCDPVAPPRQVDQFLHHFCGAAADPGALNATEPLRVAFYKAVAVLVRPRRHRPAPR